MKKVQIIGLAMFAMFAFSVVAVSTASALEFTLAAWLVNGAAVAAPLPAETTGELLLENTESKGSIVCSGILDGTIGANSLDEITKVLTLGKVEVGELTGKGIECKGENICTSGEAWGTKLPWKTEVELDTVSPPELFFELILGAEYHILCEALGIENVEETCKAPEATQEVLNVTGGVEPMEGATPNGNCGTGKENGLIFAVAGGLITSPEGPVTVSE
jgi:hypothetical protein